VTSHINFNAGLYIRLTHGAGSSASIRK